MTTPDSKARKVSCRLIGREDHAAVAALLARGFPGRSEAYWLRGLGRLAARDLPADLPRAGYLLESGGAVCGALLLIYSVRHLADGTTALRCNLSSWYVEPDFRAFASLLTSIAQKDRTTTFVNLTAARNTWPILEAQGFRKVCDGLFFSMPILSPGRGSIQRVGLSSRAVEGVGNSDLAMLTSHAALGCVSLVWLGEGGPVPLILAPFRIRNGRVPTPAMRLIYAPSLDDYRRCAGALGRFLAPRGRAFVVLGANGPIPGLSGFFTTRRGRRYVRGPHSPGPTDLTESEFVYFGG